MKPCYGTGLTGRQKFALLVCDHACMCTLGLSIVPRWQKERACLALQVVTDFFDEMKSRSKGYASMEYQITGYRPNKLVRLDVKINQEVCSTLRTSLGYPVSENLVVLSFLKVRPVDADPHPCYFRWQSPWRPLYTRMLPTEWAELWSQS